MQRSRAFRIGRLLPLIPVFIAICGFAVKWLWNWLMPVLFHLPTITFWQAFGLFILSKMLLGGFRGGGGHWRRHGHSGADSPEMREMLRRFMDAKYGPASNPPSAT